MKSVRGQFERSLDRPDPRVRVYLFHGRDEGQSRGHAERLLKGLGAERFVIPAQAAKSDPAILADEAAAIALFGGKRALWIEPAGDEIAPAVEALLDAPAAESPAIAVAGGLRKTSALLKLAEAHPLALAHVSYELREDEAARLVADLARQEGLRLAPGIAERIAGACGNERGIVVQELAKLALFAGASPDKPAEVDREILDSVGTAADGDWSRVGDLALSGDLAGLARELDGSADADAITLVRALQRRLLALAPIRAEADRGKRPHDAVTSAGKSVFWKEKDLIARLVARWDSKALARLMERSGELERKLMRKDAPPPLEALEEELVAIARSARRRRD